MTLVASWIRTWQNGQEMVVASDSRVSGGITLDQAPKILRLERNDAVLAYCGTTRVAYPLMLQIKLGLDAHAPSRGRVVDITELKSHIEKLIESVRQTISDLPDQSDENTDFKIMLAGYSWKQQRFVSWVFRFDLLTGQFNAFPMASHYRRLHQKAYFQFMSDRVENERRASQFVLSRLNRICSSERKANAAHHVDWIPFHALLDQINDEGVSDVGGAPQLVKLYKHSNTLPMNVFWPLSKRHSESGLLQSTYSITHFGRVMLGYERNDYLTLDPNTLSLVEPWKTREKLLELNQKSNERFQSEHEKHLKRRFVAGLKSLAKKKTITQRLCDLIQSGSYSADDLLRISRGEI